MKKINENDQKLLNALEDVQKIITEAVPMDFYESIDLASKIVDYIDTHFNG